MPITPPPTVDAPPTAPSTNSPSTFDALADAFVAYWTTFRTQIVAALSWLYDATTAAEAAATTAETKAAEAAASAAEATAASGVTKWISGTTYAEGAGVWSPLDYQSYRRIVAGAGTTDPSLDDVNWAAIGASSVGSDLYLASVAGAL